MKIALLIDGRSIAKWQADAIEQLPAGHQILVFNCTNAKPGRRRLRHAAYYVLNLISLRTSQTRRVQLPAGIPVQSWNDFECRADGAWQSLPEDLIDRIVAEQPTLIIKFGMGLLRVPDPSRLPALILSYHHGDPRRFRGRPAGFYELLEGQQAIGQVIQILSNRLDAGKIVAFAETKVHRHSYRKTMGEAYGASPLLLPQALRAVAEGTTLPIDPQGMVYRLPATSTVLRFAMQRGLAKARRLAYGAFVEKVWQVAEAPVQQPATLQLDAFPAPESWRTVERPAGYRFLADPFPHPDGGILVEALRSSGLGEILHISNRGCRIVLGGKGHYSYPATLAVDGTRYLIPEVSEWSGPRIFGFDEGGVRDIGALELPGSPRLVDPTLFERNGMIYLFANVAAETSSVLRLWTAGSLFESFVEHPASPIRISPSGSRMGGSIIETDGNLYRIGQDLRSGYGDGILLFRIDELSPDGFQESFVDELRFSDCHGPHTFNLTGHSILFDYYQERFSVTAGLRRLRSRLSSRPA